VIPSSVSLDEAGRRWDAVVIGAGPAGALAARQLSLAGVRVLLVDRATFPRPKVCGCCLSGAALKALDAAGLCQVPATCGAVPLQRIRLGAGRWSAEVSLSEGVSLSRDRFDAALVAEAIRSGVAFLHGTWAALGEVQPEGRMVGLRQGTRSATALASVALAADGLGGGVMARARLAHSPQELGSRLGAGVVCPESPAHYQRGVVYMACGAQGYLGLVRLEDGRLDLAAAMDATWLRKLGGPGRAAHALLRENGWPAPADMVELPWHGTPALTRQPRCVAAARVFALGDAAGYVEPFTGEGIGWALSAALAVVPLALRGIRQWSTGLESAWSSSLHRVVGRRFASRAASFVLRRPRLVRAVVAILSRAPVLARPFVRSLNAPLVPAHVTCR
jgi:flavin-dependent dehydrogenase